MTTRCSYCGSAHHNHRCPTVASSSTRRTSPFAAIAANGALAAFFAMTTLLTACPATDSPKNTDDVGDAGKDTGLDVDIPDPPDTSCKPGDVTSFQASETTGVVPGHQGKCSPVQLQAFVSCLKDFKANEADCKAWGFDPTKNLGTAFTGDCGTCLFGLPNKPGTALKVEVVDKQAFLGLNDIACVEAFAGKECGKQAQAVGDCAADACGADDNCTTPKDIQTCSNTAIQKGCGKFTAAAVGCVDGSAEVDGGDGGAVAIGDGGVTNRPAVEICGKLQTFSGDETPDEVTYALANYFCGK